MSCDSKDPQSAVDIERFILEQIDTVPHLESLLLLWRSRPKSWSVDDMAHALYLPSGPTREILQDLLRRGLIASASDTWHYQPGQSNDSLMEALDSAYRRELIRLSRLIHSKPSASIREFAKAFRLKKESE